MGKTIELPLPGTRVRVWNKYFTRTGTVTHLGVPERQEYGPVALFSYDDDDGDEMGVAYHPDWQWKVLPDPPKTVTVTVEVPVEDVKYYTRIVTASDPVTSSLTGFNRINIRVANALREALNA